jgi:hypothetical protein
VSHKQKEEQMGNSKEDVNAIVINSSPYIEGLEEIQNLLKAGDTEGADQVIEEMKTAMEKGVNCFRDVRAIGAS